MEGFSGVVPDAFIYKCSIDADGDKIKTHLINKGIGIKSVELKSHVNALTRSFKVSVESLEDFDKLNSGEFIPRNIRVKKYIHYSQFRRDSSVRGHASNSTSSENKSGHGITVSLLSSKLDELSNLGDNVITGKSHSSDSPHVIANILRPSETVRV